MCASMSAATPEGVGRLPGAKQQSEPWHYLRDAKRGGGRGSEAKGKDQTWGGGEVLTEAGMLSVSRQTAMGDR